MIIFSLPVNGQLRDSSANMNKNIEEGNALMKKSKKQRSVSLIMITGSFTLFTIALIHDIKNLDLGIGNFSLSDYDSYNNSNSRQKWSPYDKLMLYPALALEAGGIVYGILSRINKKRAKKLLQNERVHIQPQLNLKDHIVAVGMKYRF